MAETWMGGIGNPRLADTQVRLPLESASRSQTGIHPFDDPQSQRTMTQDSAMTEPDQGLA